MRKSSIAFVYHFGYITVFFEGQFFRLIFRFQKVKITSSGAPATISYSNAIAPCWQIGIANWYPVTTCTVKGLGECKWKGNGTTLRGCQVSYLRGIGNALSTIGRLDLHR